MLYIFPLTEYDNEGRNNTATRTRKVGGLPRPEATSRLLYNAISKFAIHLFQVSFSVTSLQHPSPIVCSYLVVRRNNKQHNMANPWQEGQEWHSDLASSSFQKL